MKLTNPKLTAREAAERFARRMDREVGPCGTTPKGDLRFKLGIHWYRVTACKTGWVIEREGKGA